MADTCKHLSETELVEVVERIAAAVRVGDGEAASEALNAVRPCRINVGMLAVALASAAGAVLASAATSVAGPGEVFSMPVFAAGTPSHVQAAGRMLAAATNRDTDTLNALVDAYLDTTEQIPDPAEAADFMAGVLIVLTQGLYAAFRSADQATTDAKDAHRG